MKSTRKTWLAGLLALTATAAAAAPTIYVNEDTAWRLYNEQRATKVVFRNRLVNRDQLTPLTGFVVQGATRLAEGTRSVSGALVELATFAGKTNTTEAMSLRPNLWRRSGERVLLQDYEPAEGAGMLTRGYGAEMRRIGSVRVFQMAKEPSFEEWKRLVGQPR